MEIPYIPACETIHFLELVSCSMLVMTKECLPNVFDRKLAERVVIGLGYIQYGLGYILEK